MRVASEPSRPRWKPPELERCVVCTYATSLDLEIKFKAHASKAVQKTDLTRAMNLLRCSEFDQCDGRAAAIYEHERRGRMSQENRQKVKFENSP